MLFLRAKRGSRFGLVLQDLVYCAGTVSLDGFLMVWFQDKNFLWQINIILKDILLKLKNFMDRVRDRSPARNKYFQT